MKAAIQISIVMACVAFAGSAAAQATQSTDSSGTASQAPAVTPTQAPAPQTSTTPPEAPMPQPASPPEWKPMPSDSYLYHVGAFCGSGASKSAVATKPTFGCGAGMMLLPLPVFFEVGVMGPQASRSNVSGYLSLDGNIPLARTSVKYLPSAIFGYTRMFETGHALDYGLALALPRFGKPKDPESSLRIELRDYCTFANPTQHNVVLRIGWMSKETD